MSANEPQLVWTKAIPPARDRLQSRVLVWIVLPVLMYLAFSKYYFLLQVLSGHDGPTSLAGIFRGPFIQSQGRYDNTLGQTLAISAVFALVVWRLRAATGMAALCGGIVCLLLSTGFAFSFGVPLVHSGLTPLLLLFVLTFEATRLGRARKEASGLAESHRGRNAAQVIANLGVAALCNSAVGWYFLWKCGWVGEINAEDAVARAYFAIPYIPMLAALAEATADTVSSEIGQAFGGTPRMILTLRRVPPGTDGAVTLLGTFAGIASAALIALTGIPALGMNPGECFVAFAAGVAGLFFDSLLGATLERRGWLGNDLVNFSSTAFSAVLALVAIRAFADRLF